LVTPHRARRILGFLGQAAQVLRGRLGRIIEIEIGVRRPRQQGGIGQAGKAIGRGRPRHGHGAAGQFIQRGIGQVGRSDRGGGTLDEHAQADMLGFGTFDVFQRAKPHADAFRAARQVDRIAGLCPARCARSIKAWQRSWAWAGVNIGGALH
jgi:hypothetical protein